MKTCPNYCKSFFQNYAKHLVNPLTNGKFSTKSGHTVCKPPNGRLHSTNLFSLEDSVKVSPYPCILEFVN